MTEHKTKQIELHKKEYLETETKKFNFFTTQLMQENHQSIDKILKTEKSPVVSKDCLMLNVV